MLARLLVTAAALVFAAVFAMSCGEEGGESLSVTPCIESCPDGYLTVTQCPAFTSCVEFVGCEGLLICTPPEEEHEHQNQQGNNCEDAPECPSGTTEVASCPEGQLCTRISSCDTTLLCLELTDACQNEPLCPDGDRAVEDYPCDQRVDSTCYSHLHCSGPITCLNCEDLPQACPDGLVPFSEADCEASNLTCQRVETCQETLFCAPPQCEVDPQCPEESVPLSDCSADDLNCFSLDSCGEPTICGAPTAGDDCRAIPTCPEYYEATAIETCLDEMDNCLFRAECGTLIACLPAP